MILRIAAIIGWIFCAALAFKAVFELLTGNAAADGLDDLYFFQLIVASVFGGGAYWVDRVYCQNIRRD